jgi:hypothetical protein
MGYDAVALGGRGSTPGLPVKVEKLVEEERAFEGQRNRREAGHGHISFEYQIIVAATCGGANCLLFGERTATLFYPWCIMRNLPGMKYPTERSDQRSDLIY